MKAAQIKEQQCKEQISPTIGYTEVNASEFEREMTMVYLQLKGEFSPQKTSDSIDNLAIIQDLLTPDIKDIERPVFSALDVTDDLAITQDLFRPPIYGVEWPEFAALDVTDDLSITKDLLTSRIQGIDCSLFSTSNSIVVTSHNIEIPALNTNQLLITKHASLQPFVLPKWKTDCAKFYKNRIHRPIIDSAADSAKATVSWPSCKITAKNDTHKNHKQINTFNPQYVHIQHQTDVFLNMSHDNSLLNETIGIVSSTIFNAIFHESASHSICVEIHNPIHSVMSMASDISIPEYNLFTNYSNFLHDATEGKEINKCVILVYPHIQNSASCANKLQKVNVRIDGFTLLTPHCRFTQYKPVDGHFFKFKAALSSIDTEHTPQRSFNKFLQPNTFVISFVNTKLDASTLSLTEEMPEHNHLVCNYLINIPNIQHNKCCILRSHMRIGEPCVLDYKGISMNHAGVITATINILHIEPVRISLSPQNSIVNYKVIVPTILDVLHSFQDYKTEIGTILNIIIDKIPQITTRDDFECILTTDCDFSIEKIHGTTINLQAVPFDSFSSKNVRVDCITVPKVLLHYGTQSLSVIKSIINRVRIPCSVSYVNMKTDVICRTNHRQVVIQDSIYHETLMEYAPQIQESVDFSTSPLSVENINIEVEIALEYFRQHKD